MKRYTAVLYALLFGLTLTSCEIDRGDGGVIGTIQYYLEGAETAAEPAQPTTVPAAAEPVAVTDHKAEKDVIRQRSDASIEYIGDIKDIEGCTDLNWNIFFNGCKDAFLSPAEIINGRLADLNIIEKFLERPPEEQPSDQISYTVFLSGIRADAAGSREHFFSNVIEGSIVFNDEPVGDPDGLSFIESCMAADDLANEPDFLDEMRIYSSDGGVYKAEPADGTEDYYYGASGAEDSFHIVMTDVGAVLSIGSSGENDGSNVVMAVMEDGAEVTFFDADLENGCADIHGEVDAAERVYSVFVVDSKGGNYRRLSNILEYRLVEIE